MVEVNAEPYASILLPYQYHSIAPCTLTRLDSSRLQHLSEMVLDLLYQRWGNLPKSFLKGGVIHYLYHVLCGVSTAHICGVQ